MNAKSMRKQLALLRPLMNGLSLKTIRKGQNVVGELMEFRHRGRVILKKHPFLEFEAAWVIPKDVRREGVILYLHGGGYTCGGIEYATGFGSSLAVWQGTRVFCAAYRLAPENPYPCAVEDSLEAYRYLLNKGYSPSHITICGESAGGGLCYSLCLRLREEGMQMPCGIIAISPWVDHTFSGESYNENRDKDPSMTIEKLEFFSDSYSKDKTDPLVSPLFADLSGMPPSLIFAGGDEIMLSDSVSISKRLSKAGVHNKLCVSRDRWHAYLLYGLDEDARDIRLIGRFLDRHMARANKLRWMPLDNAAKIYPAARRQNWSNVFRLSCTLKEEVDPAVLSSALDVTARRFPSIAVRLRKGAFWYYLQQLSEAPKIMKDYSYPLTRMSIKETKRCAFRVLVYKKRIAVEIFHSLTDGTGALIFLKSLVAEYLQQKYSASIPSELGVLGRLEEPSEAELEDSFGKYAGSLCASRRENTAWHMTGTPETGGFLNLTCMKLPVSAVVEAARSYGVSVTNFLCAVMMMALQNMQNEQEPSVARRKPVKVLIPVNLRNLFESRSLRNFAMYTTPEILPALGDYSFEEICRVVRCCMNAEITPKQMSMKIATNVKSERIMAVKIMPLFIKNIVMKAVFDTVGECKSCLSLSNLGAVRIPREMEEYVERFDFILGVQASAPYNCGVISYKDTLYINFIRNIKESELERHFFLVLRSLGIPVAVESNQR
ncbi:MAG: alpha/beta hydrolase fold domain-containing protein [Clostridia bacterium]|nr:alpha/beta hydrolase fold domain-containing protein [Clostridia bacterium]